MKFELELNGVKMKVYELHLPKYIAFRIEFNSQRLPIIVARTKVADKNIFRTSIPEGRQQ